MPCRPRFYLHVRIRKHINAESRAATLATSDDFKNKARWDMASSGDGANVNFIGLTAEIVSAYVGNNTVAQGDIPALINQIHQALLRVASGQQESSSEPLKPAVPVKKSIHADYIVCLEDGKK